MSDEPSTLAERNQQVATTSHIRRIANTHGVELASVQGTGVGGRISQQDVMARVAAVRPQAPPPSPSRGAGGRFGHPSPTDVSALARTPSHLARARSSASPEPTLFGGGDLPPFTASGIDPQALLQVPWQARHALASAATPREAYAIVNEFTGLSPDSAETLAVTAYGSHPGNGEYVQRVEQWVVDAMDPGTVYDRVFGENEGWGPA